MIIHRIGLFERGDLMVSTTIPLDTKRPETAVAHPAYHDGNLVIVEEYDTMTEACEGHDRWVAKMTAEKLPGALVDRATNIFGELNRVIGNDCIFEKGDLNDTE